MAWGGADLSEEEVTEVCQVFGVEPYRLQEVGRCGCSHLKRKSNATRATGTTSLLFFFSVLLRFETARSIVSSKLTRSRELTKDVYIQEAKPGSTYTISKTGKE